MVATDNDKVALKKMQNPLIKFYCTTIIGSQDIDWIGTIIRMKLVVNEIIVVRTPYVACDYVE
jgi:hypothetical protein